MESKVESVERASEMQLNKVFNQIDRLQRQVDAEAQKFDSLVNRTVRIGEELTVYKKAMVEEIGMTKEDFYTRLDLLNKKIKKTNSTVTKCKEQNDILLDRVDEFREHILKIESQAIRIDESLDETKQRKLDQKTYDKAMSEMQGTVSQLQKRIEFDEHETHQFADFILRYMPLMTQNSVVENLNQCLDSRQLEKLMNFNIARLAEYEQNLRTKLVNLLHIRET